VPAARVCSRSRRLGLAGLALQVLELLVDFLAQVVQALEVLARVAHARLGLLAALLVLGDAGGFLEIDAQVLGPASMIWLIMPCSMIE
jgi:hypothetical protein